MSARACPSGRCEASALGHLRIPAHLFTGIGLYAGNPGQYQSLAFLFKMLFVVLAGLNALLFYTSGCTAG